MATAVADAGIGNPQQILSGITGLAGVGTFTADNDASTTVTDAGVAANAQVVVFPTNSAAGLLLRTLSCQVSSVSAGSFVFAVSASAGGLPAGTETFGYIFFTES